MIKLKAFKGFKDFKGSRGKPGSGETKHILGRSGSSVSDQLDYSACRVIDLRALQTPVDIPGSNISMT